MLLLLSVTGWYAYTRLYGKVPSLTQVQADVAVTADALLTAFEKDSTSANQQYLGKIIAISGMVKAVEKEAGGATVVLGKADEMASVRCSMDSTQVTAAASLQAGSMVTIKGACTGYHPDDLGLGADIVLNRSVIVSN